MYRAGDEEDRPNWSVTKDESNYWDGDAHSAVDESKVDATTKKLRVDEIDAMAAKGRYSAVETGEAMKVSAAVSYEAVAGGSVALVGGDDVAPEKSSSESHAVPYPDRAGYSVDGGH